MLEAEKRSFLRDAAVLAAAAVVCRLLFLWLLPDGAYSVDLEHWTEVVADLRGGFNPYATRAHLNWPPLWMQLLYGLDRLSRALAVPVVDVIRWFLIAVDAVNVMLAYLLAVRFLRIGKARTLILAGLVVNPLSLLLVCQHGNFDAIVVTALLGFTIAFLAWIERGDAVDWLLAAFALGIGVLVKTIPLLLVPLLAHRASRLSIRARVLGALLVGVPAALGVSIIYVLAPGAVAENVLRYRSYSGWWGITGLLELAGQLPLSRLYSAIFPLVLAAGLILLGRAAARAEAVAPRDVVLAIGVAYLALIAFGNGYGGQYLTWPLPFFVLTYATEDPAWRRDLWTVWVVVTLTWVIEYGLIPAQGAFLPRVLASADLRQLSHMLENQGLTVLLRLPMFAAFLWLLAAAVPRLRRLWQPRNA